jgi:sporulation protein YlmC with PRC-barrel domain
MTRLNVNIDLQDLSKMKVYDKDDTEAGKIIDFCVTDDYRVSKFILGGSRIEEIKEKIGLKADDDPVISMDCIEEVNLRENKIRINLSCSELPNKLQENAFTDNETLFSSIRNTMVKSTDGTKIGRVIDALFTEDNDVSFILGDNPFVEFLEKIGLAGNYDLLLPKQYIKQRDENEITIDKSKDQLKSLLDNKEIKYKSFDYNQLNKDQITSQFFRYKHSGI